MERSSTPICILHPLQFKQNLSSTKLSLLRYVVSLKENAMWVWDGTTQWWKCSRIVGWVINYSEQMKAVLCWETAHIIGLNNSLEGGREFVKFDQIMLFFLILFPLLKNKPLWVSVKLNDSGQNSKKTFLLVRLIQKSKCKYAFMAKKNKWRQNSSIRKQSEFGYNSMNKTAKVSNSSHVMKCIIPSDRLSLVWCFSQTYNDVCDDEW